MKKLLLILLPLFFATASFAQISKPILTINSTMHTTKIGRISTDALGRIMLTCSKDKTAKLWDANSGDLLKTFRIPIASGREGMLYACALSPDAKTAVVAGWTNDLNTKDNCIYIFDVSSGEIKKRIPGLPDVIRDLEFSPDGDYLAASLASKGVRIYSVYQNFSIYKRLTEYGNDVYNVAFDSKGRFATVCDDGYLRLYSQSFRLIKEHNNLAGIEPFSLAFSPDGNKIAVAYYQASQIQVFDGNSLRLLYEPDITDATTQTNNLEVVSFSSDGRFLMAGGDMALKKENKWWYQIRVWNQAGRGSYSDYSACTDGVMDIKPLPDGSFIYCGTQPDFGRITLSGSRKFYQRGAINSYNARNRTHLRVNYDGSQVGVTPFGNEALSFDLNKRELRLIESSHDSYIDNNYSVVVSDWRNKYNPTINDNEVSFFQRSESARSTDISSKKTVVFGCSWNIYKADEYGNKIWGTPVQGEAWTTNITGDDKLVVSAQGDGTVRWYTMDDGELLLSLYLHPDNRRWVVWTPSGYYDCSPGAEDLIGWHLNNGPDNAAYYFPASKFRNKYYRPDVIDNMLIALNEDVALSIANTSNNRKSSQISIGSILPPVVSIISPDASSETAWETIGMKYSVTSPNGELITQVKFLIDGRPLESQSDAESLASGVGKKTISIPKRDVVLQVMAQNQHGWSVPAQVQIKWTGAKDLTNVLKPTLYVLSIGVSDYANDRYDLKFAAKDATDFSNSMKAQEGGLYKEVRVKLLTDGNATKDDILDGLDWIQHETTARDMAMIFVAGHGMNDNVGVFYFLPNDINLESLRRTGLMFTELKYTTSAIAGKVVMFVDACHSGDVMGGRRGVPDVNVLVNELSDVESGAVVFTSSTGKQFSLENSNWGNGAFTKALVEGLNGKADLFDNGTITIKSLDAYIAQRVKELTGGKQSPTVVIPQSIPDFPIGIVK